ncbi:LacI family DNA-binding transcriptional regulator [Ottowia thiooxydans]|uniref:LacI family gluconate utilization system Gnt-I transcriptional repressor n=1 Tax=Ottowia thiooxydans TaxID=219182 RepID=A0ABV2QC87_9BURK
MEKPRRGRGRTTTMDDVARLAGVSIMTVSNVFQKPGKVHHLTRERVRQAALSLNYVPNRAASELASGRSNAIAAIVPFIRNSSFSRTIEGLEERAWQHGFELLLAVADSADRETRAIRNLIGRRPDGIVLTGAEHNDEAIEVLLESGIPVVETWTVEGSRFEMTVGNSLYQAAFDVTERLLERGYRRIGFIGHDAPVSRRFSERQRGFEAALSKAGVTAAGMCHVSTGSGFSGGSAALESLTSQADDLQAVLCVTDVVAAGVMFECMRRGWDIPAKLAVAGYGDFEIASQIPPGLTTIKTRGYEIGARAADLLVEHIHHGQVVQPHVDVGYDIIERGSI